MNYKSHGFTIFEVLMAMGILVVAATIITGLQMRALNRVLRDRDDIKKMFLVRQELQMYMLKPPKKSKKTEKELAGTEMVINTYPREIEKKSSLYKYKDVLNIIRCEGSWKENKVRSAITLTTLRYKAPSTDEGNKK